MSPMVFRISRAGCGRVFHCSSGMQRASKSVTGRPAVSGEWARPPTVRMVSLQAAHNGEAAAFRLTWDDPTREPEGAADRLALFFKPAGTQGDVVTLQAWPYQGSPQLDICLWTSSNKGEAAEAITPDWYLEPPVRNSWTFSPPPTRNSAAHYEDGRWTLVLQRSLDPGDAPFPPNKKFTTIAVDGFTSIAFAAWDGGNPEVRAVSAWLDLSLHDPQSHRTKH